MQGRNNMQSRFARSCWAIATALCSASWLGACSSTPLGASDVNLAKAKDQAAAGAQIYAAQCAKCHGDHGQGKNAPQLMGAGALPEYPRDGGANQRFTDPQEIEQQVQTRAPGTPSREPFTHAGDVFDYVSRHMPPGKLKGTLRPEEYWSVVHFILTAHGVAVPAGGLTPQNASSVSVSPP